MMVFMALMLFITHTSCIMHHHTLHKNCGKILKIWNEKQIKSFAPHYQVCQDEQKTKLHSHMRVLAASDTVRIGHMSHSIIMSFLFPHCTRILFHFRFFSSIARALCACVMDFMLLHAMFQYPYRNYFTNRFTSKRLFDQCPPQFGTLITIDIHIIIYY